MSASFCAVCLSETGPFQMRPLGRNDAPVPVCAECDDTHPRSGRYGFGGGREHTVLAAAGDGNRRRSRAGGTS